MKLTNAERLAGCMRAAQLYAMITMDWGEEEYYDFVFEQGMKYLELAVPDSSQVALVAAHQRFWVWWKQHWYRRDAEWLHYYNMGCLPVMSIAGVRLAYRKLHNAEELAKVDIGFGRVLEESYCRELVPELRWVSESRI